MKASISVVRLLDRLARGVWVIAINEFLTNSAFAPDDIKVLVTAFEGALQHLRLVNRKDPATSLVAGRIIALAQQGERDPSQTV